MARELPDAATVRAAIALAGRAPSIHNSQPWLWMMRDGTLELSVQRRRWLTATDPTGGDLVLSCGIALHHAEVAFAGLGWSARVQRLPGNYPADCLAVLDFWPQEPADHDVVLSAAISTRRSDRRAYSARRMRARELRVVETAAAARGVLARRVIGRADRAALGELSDRAATDRLNDPVWRIEQRQWIGRFLAPGVGVPVTNVPGTRQLLERQFPEGLLDGDPITDAGVGEVLLLATENDDVGSRLRAGEAASSVMLEATAMGLSTCALSQVIEVEETRQGLRRALLASRAAPQLLVRIGRRQTGSISLPATPRLPLDAVLRFSTHSRR